MSLKVERNYSGAKKCFDLDGSRGCTIFGSSYVKKRMPACSTTAGRSRYTLWVCDRDESGEPVDPQFIEAAYALESSLFSYRRREIGCESVTADLIQSSVNAASRAAHSKPVENPPAYLYSVFTRKVDKYLASRGFEISVGDDFIEDLGVKDADRPPTAEELDERILMREVKAQMDDWTRQVCNMRINGYSIEEIARGLGEPTNRVAVRYSRGISKAANRVIKGDKRKLKADD